jgi:transketolase
MNQQTTVRTSQLAPSALGSLKTMAQRLRRHSLISTSEAASGHPSSCCSCADIVATLFFKHLRYDVANPSNIYNDRFILSKGHAAPVLWAAWAEAGAFPVEKMLTLRRIDSDLEGHPTFRSPYSGAATGSLGQGLSVGVGTAFAAKLDQTGSRTYVLLGDGEVAEGAVWEAAALASYYHLDNLIAIVDVNRLGQSQATMYGHNLSRYESRFQANGWNTLTIDGHDFEQIHSALSQATASQVLPTAIIARTKKGKGVSLLEDLDSWHGKPLKKGDELEKALAELGSNFDLEEPLSLTSPSRVVVPDTAHASLSSPPDYAAGSQAATRESYGVALKKLGVNSRAVVALDGDVKNSTYSDKFMKEFPDRFIECFIAEQNMVGAAVGLGSAGKIPFASSFACFLARAYDFIRMAGIGKANLKLCGSHAGVSIGEDGPSQMGLEDIAMMRPIAGSTVLYPSDGVSTERLVELAAQTPGIVYIRTTRPKTPILYSVEDTFPLGGSKVLRSGADDKVTVVAAGITLHETLDAYEQLRHEGIEIRVIDLYSVKPIDIETLRQAARDTGAIVTVEDHYPEGGLGEAVSSALAGERCQFRMLAVMDVPRSGKGDELLEMFGISASAIVRTVKELVSTRI